MTCVEGRQGETVLCREAELAGGSVALADCRDCLLLLLGPVASLTVDDCHNCVLVVGACRGSIFLRDSHLCTVFANCQQLRCRDSSLLVHLRVSTDPIVENSSVCIRENRLRYPSIEEHCTRAGLDQKPNLCDQVHDFTPDTSRVVLSTEECDEAAFGSGLDAASRLEQLGVEVL